MSAEGGDLMKWENGIFENTAIKELEFYMASEDNLRDLHDAIEDLNSDDYIYPACTSYHYCEGRITVHSPDIEKIVIEKLEREEMLQKGVDRLKRKVSCIESALSLLNEDEREVIDYLILYPGELELRKIQFLIGLKNQVELMRLRRKALIKFYRYLRKEKATFKKQLIKEEHKQAIELIKKKHEKEQLEKNKRKIFIQSIKDKQRTLV